MDLLLAWSRTRTVAEAILACLVVNVGVFLLALALGEVVVRLWRARPISDPAPAVTARERLLATTCVVLNSLVMFVGWSLFVRGLLRVEGDAPAWRWIVDALVLLFVMDVAMYATHRLAHHDLVFRWVHGVHHLYDRPRPLTLFVLHPIEVLGFGGLWIVVLLAHVFSLGGMLLYLTANTVFGVVGHVGVEPLPPAWGRVARLVGTSTFHARHHRDPGSNYGFYTTVWDRLFRTLGRTR